jgi:hypothetical protein
VPRLRGGKASPSCSWLREIEAIIGDVVATVEGGAFDDAIRLKGWEVEGGRALLREPGGEGFWEVRHVWSKPGNEVQGLLRRQVDVVSIGELYVQGGVYRHRDLLLLNSVRGSTGPSL